MTTAAASRRELERAEFDKLNALLPLSHAVSSALDKVTIVRVTGAFIALQKFLRRMPIARVKKETCGALDLSRPAYLDISSLILQSVDGFALVFDVGGRIVYASETASVHLGFSQVEIMGCSVYPFLHPDDVRELRVLLADCVKYYEVTKCGVEIRFSLRLRCLLSKRNAGITRSGYKTIHFWSQTLPMQEENSMALISLGTALAHSGGLLETKLTASMFMFRARLDLRMVFVDSRIADITGYSPVAVLDQSLYKLVHVDDVTQLVHAHRTVITKQQAVTSYFRIMARGGGYTWVQGQLSLIPLIRAPTSNCILGIITALSGRVGTRIEDTLQLTPFTPRQRDYVLGEYSTSFYQNPIFRDI
ncbi:hypothetical protein L596_001290 [Steinernema carpocapsae]|uniref:PAS domain-containing protein n=1 Tax=Steinernema carpocapsae TaxID=34508 RepID=A0A4U8UMV8_STECR|nr:hypothetical protein L596_001290 [Steinernema carpocapsae]